MTSLSFTRHSIDHSLWFCQQQLCQKIIFHFVFCLFNLLYLFLIRAFLKIFFLLTINCRGKIHNVSNQDQIANCTPCTNRYHGNKRCNYVLQEHKKEQRIESPWQDKSNTTLCVLPALATFPEQPILFGFRCKRNKFSLRKKSGFVNRFCVKYE